MNREKQIEEKSCEKCLHYYACLRNSEYYPEKPCFAYEDKAGYRKQSEGEWKTNKIQWQFVGEYYYCSNCDGRSFVKHHYCPNCGAKMKGGE